MPDGSPGRGRDVIVLAVALLAIAAVLRGMAFGSALPAWQGPDETAHVAYVERIADQGVFPPFEAGEPARMSQATTASWAWTGFDPMRLRAPFRPFSSQWGAQIPREPPGAPVDGLGNLGASSYPPLYYAALAPAYLAPGGDSGTDRLFAMRSMSALLGGLLVLLTFWLAVEAGASRRVAALAALLISLLPMISQASALVNPDIFLACAATGLAASALRATRDTRPTWRGVLHVAAWGLAVALSKPVGPPLAVAIVAPIALVRLGDLRVRTRWLIAGVTGLVVVPLLALFGTAVLDVRPWGDEGIVEAARFASSYLWQFYLPALPWMQTIDPVAFGTPPFAIEIWLRTGVGTFGWLNIFMPEWVYVLAGCAVVAAVAGGIAIALKARGPRRSPVVALLLGLLGIVLILHATEAVALLNDQGRLLQGRYLIPGLPLAAAALAAVCSRLPRLGVPLVGGLCAVAALVGVLGLETIARWYAA